MSDSISKTANELVHRTRTNARLVVVLFALLLLAPAFAQVVGIGGSSAENRELAAFPRIARLKEMKDLPRMLEAYVNDRFGLRSQLVYFNSKLRYWLGISSNKDVVIGDDGWLFYTADKILEQHTGADRFKEAELDQWIRRMEANRDWLERRGIAFFILVAPEKTTIYPDKLPDYPRPSGVSTRLDQMTDRLRSSTLVIIDPREALSAARARGLKVYFEGDTHWTQRGAFIAYSLLMERVRQYFPNLVVRTEEDYSITVNSRPTADLARHLMLENDLSYTIEHFAVRGRRRQLGPQTRTFRVGWPRRIEEVKTDLDDQPRLLVFGDSFTDYVLGPSFLYETFRDPVWTHHNLGTFNFKLVNEVKPAIVIFQLAERYLHARPGTPLGFE